MPPWLAPPARDLARPRRRQLDASNAAPGLPSRPSWGTSVVVFLMGQKTHNTHSESDVATSGSASLTDATDTHCRVGMLTASVAIAIILIIVMFKTLKLKANAPMSDAIQHVL